tara:strand:+ start:556 stop:852 length:297 start_codon:yes stop_codon:yes gene_type:complete
MKRKINTDGNNTRKKRFREGQLEFSLFSKFNFIHFLEIIEEGETFFEEINQQTVESLNMILRENNSYSEFKKNTELDILNNTVTEDAFKYLFGCYKSY